MSDLSVTDCFPDDTTLVTRTGAVVSVNDQLYTVHIVGSPDKTEIIVRSERRVGVTISRAEAETLHRLLGAWLEVTADVLVEREMAKQ